MTSFVTASGKTTPSRARTALSEYRSLSDRYSLLLAFSLGGLALLGKGYAYAGVPPLFVTEMTLALGLVILLRNGCLLPALSKLPMILLACLIVLAVIQLAVGISTYGLNTLRDSVLVLYSLFAVIVAALLLEQPRRAELAVGFLRRLTGVFVFVAPFVYLANRVGFLPPVPGWPAAGSPAMFTRAGELGVHLSGCTVMVLLGLRPAGRLWCCALLVDICLVIAQSRGGMLALCVPVVFALVVARRWRIASTLLVGSAMLLGLLYVSDLDIPLKDADARSVSGQQIVENMVSLVMPSDAGNLDGTKEWRELWWATIENYTFHGPYFWTGKGFGINLAEADGFTLGQSDFPDLRSPHNSHLNVLARLGVPGFTLWCLIGLSWMLSMLRTTYLAWAEGDRAWGNLMLLTACYWLAIVIDAAFDVAIEGPMMGVWFWCLFGFGMGLVMIYQARNSRAVLPGRRLISDAL